MAACRSGICSWLEPSRCAWVCAVVALVLLPNPAQAHPESLSTLRIVLSSSGAHATLTLPVRDLTRWFPPGKYPNYIADVVADLRKQATGLLDVRWEGAAVVANKVDVHRGETGYIIAEMYYSVAPREGELLIHPLYFGYLPNDHQQVLTIVNARGGTATERILAEETLNAQDDTLTIGLPEALVASGAEARSDGNAQATWLRGLASVISGYGHFLFLGMVLLIVLIGVWLVQKHVGRSSRGVR